MGLILAGAQAKSCRRCGAPFTSKPKAHGQRFCSVKCRERWNFKHRYYPRHVQSKKPRWIVRFCANPKCRIRFSVSGRGRGHQHRKYCSEPCGVATWKRNWRNRQRAKGRKVS